MVTQERNFDELFAGFKLADVVQFRVETVKTREISFQKGICFSKYFSKLIYWYWV